MRILVSGSIGALAPLGRPYGNLLGFLLGPRNNNRSAVLHSGLPFGVDNGAYSGFDPDAFRGLLTWLRNHVAHCLWVVCPDVVGDAAGTLALFESWREEIAAAAVPRAFVGQDGAEDLEIPWQEFDCWFIGGTTRWKLSQASVDLAREAKRQGKLVHCGRVNSMKRLRWAPRIDCDSCDGSSYSRFYHRRLQRLDRSLERHLRFLQAQEHVEKTQRLLFPTKGAEP